MERVPQLVRRGKNDRRMGAPSELDWEAIEALRTEMRVELIQELIPLGLAEVGRVLDEEVERLAGPRHARKGEGEVIYRHGSNPGSVRLGGQRHPVRVPDPKQLVRDPGSRCLPVIPDGVDAPSRRHRNVPRWY